jgi:hypothetical protein
LNLPEWWKQCHLQLAWPPHRFAYNNLNREI